MQIRFDYRVVGLAPIELWDSIPEIIPGTPRYEDFSGLAIAASKNNEVLDRIGPDLAARVTDYAKGMKHDIHFLKPSGSKGEYILTEVMESKEWHKVYYWISEMVKTGRCQDRQIISSIERISQSLADDARLIVTDLSIEGKLLPVPEGIDIVAGAEAWNAVTRYFSDYRLDILYVPSKSSGSSEDLKKAAFIFPEPDYKKPQENHMELITGMVFSEGNTPAAQIFCMAERYLTLLYSGFFQIAGFIRWAKEDSRTGRIAEMMESQYSDSVSIELRNMSESIYGSIPIIDRLAGAPLPPLELPFAKGRATGYMDFDQHARIVEQHPGSYARSSEKWIGEMTEFMYAPLL